MPITDRQFNEVVEMVKTAFIDGRKSIEMQNDDEHRQYYKDKYSDAFISHDVRLIFGGEVEPCH